MLHFLFRRMLAPLVVLSLLVTSALAHAADLVLAEEGKSNYQIVLPDESTTGSVNASMKQIARMVQTAFKANGFDVVVVHESQRDQDKPGLFLGDTQAARQAGIQTKDLPGWGYVLRVVEGKDLIIAGHDHPAIAEDGYERLGTAKAAADFLREFMGVRFLFPEMGQRQPLSNLEKYDLLDTPAIEYFPQAKVVVPADLDRKVTPLVEFIRVGRGATDFYHMAVNRFPTVDALQRVHSWGDAIPRDKYGKEHPEYFALVGGKRLWEDIKNTNAQYCISNPQVQEIMYQNLIDAFKKGYRQVDLGQPDGFRGCQCEPCSKLYDTGDDWGEKIWIFHRNLAQRANEEFPDRIVVIMSYIQTRNPPKSFDTFPPNVRVMLTGVNEHEVVAWRDVNVPQGFSGYAYFWTPNLNTRYTPAVTPGSLEKKVRHLTAMRFYSLYLDTSGGFLFGLEGPAYHVMGRMFDDPQNNNAQDLVNEYISAAYGRAGHPMTAFYRELYHNVELYARFLATREEGWTYSLSTGRGRKYMSDPFRLLGSLYTPELINTMETQLVRAEKAANTPKIKARLNLVRREFEYLKHLAKVTHLYQAYDFDKNPQILSVLLDALDERNAFLATLYENRGRVAGWPANTPAMFPPGGHSINHLIPQYNTYQTPFANTFVNWDTAQMRAAMNTTTESAVVLRSQKPPTIHDKTWRNVQPIVLKSAAGSTEGGATTQARLLHDTDNLYVRIEAGSPDQEKIHLHLSPAGQGQVSYRFTVSGEKAKEAQAARGLLEDAMDPRFGQYDPDWTGQWSAETSTQYGGNRLYLVTIPWSSLKMDAPANGSVWKFNLVRDNAAGGKAESIWSQRPGSKSSEDLADFGQITFEEKRAGHPVSIWREGYDQEMNYRVPQAWESRSAQARLSIGPWLFRGDGTNQGLEEKWFSLKQVSKENWVPIEVPSFWAENESVGKLEGYGWYHTTLTLPAGAERKGLDLWFGAVDEQAWVYVNGQLAGEHSTESTGLDINALWQTPFQMHVPASQLKAGENVVMVRVHNSMANGGIWRPVYAAVKE